jgi:hypothetical protein
MPRFFPQHTVEWRVQEPRFVRRLSLQLVPMALVAGMLSRLLRWAVMGVSGSNLVLVLGIVLGLFTVLGLATAHLGNFPVRHWLWRAPLFGFLVGVADALASGVLTLLGLERFGTSEAHFNDWVASVGQVIMVRLLLVSLFAAVLAAAVQIVRYALLKREHREHTAQAIHEEHLRTHEE